jgi:hypothetical protein
MTHDKLKAGVFTGPQIRKLMSDPFFENSMEHFEKEAWPGFKNIVENFLRNRGPDYKDIVHNLSEHFKNLSCSMNIKLRFLPSHIDYFPQNLG